MASLLRTPLILLLALALLLPATALAQGAGEVGQVPGETTEQAPGADKPFNILDELGGGVPGGVDFGAESSFWATFKIERGKRVGRLEIKAMFGDGWHMYSLTQQTPPIATKIVVAKSPAYQITGPFESNVDPRISASEFYPVPMEEHYEEVIWSAPLELADDAVPATLKIPIDLTGQICKEVCKEVAEKLEATFDGYYEVSVPSGQFRAEASHATIRGHLEPSVVKPGGTVTLVLTAEPDSDWHVYEWAETDALPNSKSTLLVLTKASGLKAGPVVHSKPAVVKETGFPEQPTLSYYEGNVDFRVELQVPRDFKPGKYRLIGLLGYQTCKANSCDNPTAASFQGEVTVGSETEAGEVMLSFEQGDYADAASFALTQTSQVGEFDRLPVVAILGLAFLAGLILNVMPCVLPVIGLKIMSFVQQAGQSRWQIFALNFWFSLGLLSVFMALATAAVFLNFGWGDQFRSAGFSIAMVAIVFVFALSFLGVWEVPIPGFVGGEKAGKLAEKEGPSGAFAKGILTTLLATPCSGPFLGPAVGWAIAQPAWLTYGVFAAIGIGMASPYVLIGAFPQLMRLLPKPGAWMETFKQLMGFVLLGTVVFLVSSVGDLYIIPTLAMCVGLGLACWYIGRIPITAVGVAKALRWAGAVVLVIASVAASFGLLVPWHELDWQPYSKVVLEDHREEGRTVLVDFTADW